MCTYFCLHLPLRGFESVLVQSVAWSLYRLLYSGVSLLTGTVFNWQLFGGTAAGAWRLPPAPIWRRG